MQVAAQSVETSEASWEESVSAWMDGEESDDISPIMLSPQGRQTWDTYHLIGDALRSADLAVSPSAAFQARLARALDAELPIVAAPRRRSPWKKGLSTMALAAVVAVAAWMGEPYLEDGAGRGSPPAAGARVLASGGDNAGLMDYLEVHREMAGPSAVRLVSLDMTGAGR